MSAIVPLVAQAIEEIRSTFEECVVTAEADGSGGALCGGVGNPAG